jgi:fructokinase
MFHLQPNIVCFGEMLWDVLPTGARPGGAPMNVAYHLKKLGAQPVLISRLGRDDYGKELMKLLMEQELPTDFVQWDDEHKTGIVNAHPGPNNEVTYDIVSPVAWDFISMQNSFPALMQGATYIVYGSLAARNEVTKGTLLQLLEGATKKVFDVNLRPPHFNENIIKQLLKGVTILKLNEDELLLLAGWFGNVTGVASRIKLLQDKFNIPTVIVTRGGAGALLNVDGQLFEHNGYSVSVADTVGCGDAFLAGLLYQFNLGTGPPGALNFASALGALIATRSGACPPYRKEEINVIMQTGSV